MQIVNDTDIELEVAGGGFNDTEPTFVVKIPKKDYRKVPLGKFSKVVIREV